MVDYFESSPPKKCCDPAGHSPIRYVASAFMAMAKYMNDRSDSHNEEKQQPYDVKDNIHPRITFD
jgi:hypothetical protein